MFRRGVFEPELVPVLSRGKHRNPRKGACFMEMASYLAGEPWSDHPACTHPLLASLARLVNDHTSDEGRQRLAELVPSVIGLTSDDPHVDIDIALRAATTALPIAAAERQRVIAVGVLAIERVRNDLDEPTRDRIEDVSRWALEQVPEAAEWARTYSQRMHTTLVGFRRHGAPTVVGYSVVGIARACVLDPDSILHDLLVGAIADCEARVAAERRPVPSTRPAVDTLGDRTPTVLGA